MKTVNFYDLRTFDTATSIDRSGAESLISEQLASEIIQSTVEQSAVLSLGKRLQDMTSAQTRVPVLSLLPIAYFLDGDTSKKKTTKQAWDKKVINAAEVAVIVPVPESVLEDADYDIISEVQPRLVEAFGRAIDAAVLFGDGKPSTWPDGILTQAETAGTTLEAGANLYDDLLGVGGTISKVEDSGYFVSGHVSGVGMRAKLRALKDNDGRPLFSNNMQDRTNYALDGSPIHFLRNGAFDAKKAEIISGDFDQLVYAIRKDITFKILDQAVIQNPDGTIAYNLAQDDMIAIRAVMRLGWEVPNPVNGLKTDKSQRFPFAVLKPAAE